jgi:hypothetical protein
MPYILASELACGCMEKEMCTRVEEEGKREVHAQTMEMHAHVWRGREGDAHECEGRVKRGSENGMHMCG